MKSEYIRSMNENKLSIIGLGYVSLPLAAAGTKWNFLKYTPGLVGGHCISVDPYYLSHKAERLCYRPAVILSGREVNQLNAYFCGK